MKERLKDKLRMLRSAARALTDDQRYVVAIGLVVGFAAGAVIL